MKRNRDEGLARGYYLGGMVREDISLEVILKQMTEWGEMTSHEHIQKEHSRWTYSRGDYPETGMQLAYMKNRKEAGDYNTVSQQDRG